MGSLGRTKLRRACVELLSVDVEGNKVEGVAMVDAKASHLRLSKIRVSVTTGGLPDVDWDYLQKDLHLTLLQQLHIQ